MNQRNSLKKTHSKNAKSTLISNGIYFGHFLNSIEAQKISTTAIRYLGKPQTNPVQLTSSKIKRRIKSPIKRLDTSRGQIQQKQQTIMSPRIAASPPKLPLAPIAPVGLMTSDELNKSIEILQEIANTQVSRTQRRRPQTAVQKNTVSFNIRNAKQNQNDYVVTEVLGQGSYGLVKLAVNKANGQQVAIKVYEKNCMNMRRDYVRREIQVLQQLSHPSIVQLLDVVHTETQIQIVMEYAGSTSLRQHLRAQKNRQLTESEARPLFQQLVRALDYIHRKNIIHRDIKLENVLIKEGRIKVIDFGFSAFSEIKQNFYCGTPSYMAPEIINKLDYGKPADVWSLGVLLFVLLHGRFPFSGKDQAELFSRIKSGFYSFGNISPTSQRLIGQMLKVRPYERLNTKEILRDNWFQQM